MPAALQQRRTRGGQRRARRARRSATCTAVGSKPPKSYTASWRGAASSTGSRARCAPTARRSRAAGRRRRRSPGQALQEGAGLARVERDHRRAVGDEDRGQGRVHGADWNAASCRAVRSTALHARRCNGLQVAHEPLTCAPMTHRLSIAPRLAWPGARLGRDFRAGELRLLLVAVTLAVAALTAVGFFADRLKSGLARDARQLLGGDAIVASDQPTPADLHRARARGSACGRDDDAASRAWAAPPDDQGGASAAGRAEGGQRGLPAARPAEAVATRRGGAERWSRAARRAARVWVDARAARRAAAEDRRPAAARRRGAAARAHHRHRARPRRRLHELRAARDAERGRPRGHRADPAGQPRQLPARRGRPGRSSDARRRLRRVGRGRS